MYGVGLSFKIADPSEFVLAEVNFYSFSDRQDCFQCALSPSIDSTPVDLETLL